MHDWELQLSLVPFSHPPWLTPLQLTFPLHSLHTQNMLWPPGPRALEFPLPGTLPQVAQRLPPHPLQVSAQTTPIKMLTLTLDLQGGASAESHTGAHLRVVGTAIQLQQMPTIQVPMTAPAAGRALPGGRQ